MDAPPEHQNHREHGEFLRAPQAADNEIPVSVAFDALLASTGNLVVFVSGLRVFSNGVELAIEARARKSLDHKRLVEALHRTGHGQLLLGVEFSDGRRASNIAHGRTSGPTAAPTLWPGGGHGGRRSANLSLFLSPLPPPGDLRLVFAWPAQGIEDRVTPLPADRILGAARRVIQLWPWEPEEEGAERPTHPNVPGRSWFAADIARYR